MKVLLASGNAHKAEEFAALLDPQLIEVGAAPEKIEVDETGTTFNENALLKAEAFYEKFKMPVLADDSGLVVEAMPDELGIYSARFGGEGLSDKDRALLLLEKMKEKENRKAHFVCVLCLYLNPKEIFFFEGRMNGAVGDEYRGEHGFGYDPVFVPEKHEGEQTVAELPEWKDENSHRANACQMLSTFLKGQINK